jgi:hypothetical protein
LRLATKPASTGSTPLVNTMGMAEKAWLATRVPRWKISTVVLVIRGSFD